MGTNTVSGTSSYHNSLDVWSYVRLAPPLKFVDLETQGEALRKYLRTKPDPPARIEEPDEACYAFVKANQK